MIMENSKRDVDKSFLVNRPVFSFTLNLSEEKYIDVSIPR